ncbi:lipopolysaccharide biosynthesis protein [Psychromonas sp. KJ10-10]|uniref:lipopolysaccharide biosynthesis protein n=1 Tax=Psychromonas sp. KJ10-10 TaxID=3391823 RepID=UPI0039B3BBA7
MLIYMLGQRFSQLKNTLKPEEFNSIDFLKQKAEELKHSDKELSDRVLVRVKNLQNQKREKSSAGSSQLSVKETKNKNKQNVKVNEIQKGKLKAIITSPFMLLVILPFLLFTIYQVFIATERFESKAQVIVQQPDSMSTMDAGMALLSGIGVSSGGSDTELVKAYIYSNDMVQYLNHELDLRNHYTQGFIDYFSRIHESDSRDELLSYFQERVKVDINEKSGIITISSQGFDSEYAQLLTNKIVNRAEWFINSIGHQLANEQLAFIKGEHENIERKFAKAQTDLLNFQQQYNLLDPTAEGVAMQEITYTLEGQIATKETELKTAEAIMSPKSPQVLSLQNELKALSAQLKTERNKLAQSGKEEIAVSELLAKFTDYKVKMELALQAYTSSQISLEKSRIEAYRQIKYLIVVEKATLSEEKIP